MIEMLSKPFPNDVYALRAARKAGIQDPELIVGEDRMVRYRTNGPSASSPADPLKAPGATPLKASVPKKAKAKKAAKAAKPAKKAAKHARAVKATVEKAEKLLGLKAEPTERKAYVVRPLPDSGDRVTVAKMMGRKRGATVAEMAKAIGKPEFNTRFLIAQVKAFHGYAVERVRENKITRYFATAPA